MRAASELLELSPELEDAFVEAAHDRPTVAIQMLRRYPHVVWATSGWGETAQQAACHLGHRSLLAALLDAGAELDLFSACVLGDTAIIRALLRSVPRLEYGIHDLPLLHFGVISGEISVVELLIAEGAAVNPPRASLPPLHSAVAAGFPSAVEVLLSAGADVTAKDPFGDTALDWALALDGPGSAMVAMLSA